MIGDKHRGSRNRNVVQVSVAVPSEISRSFKL